jgi:multidrug resistance protein
MVRLLNTNGLALKKFLDYSLWAKKFQGAIHLQMTFKKMSPSTEILVIVCICAFIDSLAYGIIIPFLPQYAISLGASDLQVGIIFASYALVQLVTVIPFGLMSDRYGRRPFMIAGMLLLGAASLLYPLARTVPLMILCRAVQGLAASATWSSATALVADMYPGKDKGFKLGITSGITNTGSIAGPLAGGVISSVNFDLPFLIIASACMVMFIYMVFRLKVERREESVERIPYRRMIGESLKIRNVLIIVIINVLTTIFWGFLEPLMPPYLSGRFSLSSTQIGLVFGAMTLAYAIIQPVVGRLSDKYGRKKFIVSGMILMALANLIIPLSWDAVSLTVFMVLSSALAAVAWTPLTPLVIDSLQDRRIGAYATVQSLFDIAFYVGYSIGPVIGSFMSSYFGFESMFIFYSLILVVCLIFSQAYMQEIKKKKVKQKRPIVELAISQRRRLNHGKGEEAS